VTTQHAANRRTCLWEQVVSQHEMGPILLGFRLGILKILEFQALGAFRRRSYGMECSVPYLTTLEMCVLFGVHWNLRGVLHPTSGAVTSADCFVDNHSSKKLDRSLLVERSKKCNSSVQGDCYDNVIGHCYESEYDPRFTVAFFHWTMRIAYFS
jgi:hypothetical protein